MIIGLQYPWIMIHLKKVKDTYGKIKTQAGEKRQKTRILEEPVTNLIFLFCTM